MKGGVSVRGRGLRKGTVLVIRVRGDGGGGGVRGGG